MFRCLSSTSGLSGPHRPFSQAVSFCLAPTLALLLGCGGASTDKQQKVDSIQEDPEAEFEWGMTRLKRALRLFRPTGAEGLSTQRNVECELIPPNEKNPNYSARVTVVSETSFLHGKRLVKKEDKAAPAKEEFEIDDPYDNKDKELSKYVDIPGTGPQAPAALAAGIETRSLDSKSVFELDYLEGRWQLAQQPELKHEQGWFEYAFE